MSENQSSTKSTVEGELNLDDLEKIAGGTLDSSGFFPGDTPVVANKDSSYTSYFGAAGTTFASHAAGGGMPFNLTSAFP
jgi:hypothetical protein